MKPWKILTVFIFLAEILTEFIVSIMDFLINGAVTYDFLITGAVAALIVSFIILTIIIMAQRRLSESEELLRSITDNAGTVIFLKDLDGRYLHVNRHYEKLFHVSNADVQGKTDYEIFPVDMADAFIKNDKMVAQVGSAVEVEERVPHDDGLHTYISVKFPIRRINGEIYAVCGIATDITTRKQAEEKLVLSEAKYRNLIETTQQGIWVIDIDSRTTFVNPRMAQMLGYKVEEMNGRHLFSFMDEKGVKIAQAHVERRKQAISEQHDFEFIKKDGARIFVAMETSPMFEGGDYIGAVAGVIDITERNRIVMMEAEGYYEKVMEGTAQPMALFANGIIKFANKAIADFIGAKSRDELIGRPVLDFVHKDFKGDSAALIKDADTGNLAPKTFERKYIRLDGEIRNAEMTAVPVKYRGAPAIIGIIKDVTERNRIEETVRQSEARYRELFENASDFISTHDLTGAFTSVNHALCQRLGYRAEELVGAPFSKVVPSENLDKVRAMLETKLKGERFQTRYEVELIAKNGEIVPIDLTSRVIFENGNPVGIQGISHDISERKRREKEISFEMNELREVVDSNTDFFYIHNTEGKIVKWNKALEKLTGLSPQELMLKPTLEFVCEEDRPLVLQRMQEVFEKGFGEVEARFISADGTLIPCLCNGYVLRDTNGNVTGFAGTGRDISERKVAEEKLKAAKEDAENATRLKNNFISLVAHDLKSPLASLSMGLNALATAKEISSENRDFAKKMADHSREIHKMTERLLDLSLLQRGMIILQKRVINCRYFAFSQIELYEAMAAHKGITIVNSLPEKMKVYADPDLFGECVKNLLSNAIKFCRQGDTVTFFNPPDMPTTMAIKDNGPGIVQEKLPPLLAKEMKMRTVGTAGEKGTGIGLVHTKEILEAHGGVITFESEVGRGSTFYLNLPVFDNMVLVVDDDEVSTFVLCQYLKDMGSEVLTAKNGAEALEIIQGRPPILIITDIKMPVMDGLELLHNLRTNPKHSQIPVIIITSNDDIDVRKMAFANKAVDFIIKPLSEPDFIPRIGRFIEGSLNSSSRK